MRKKNDIDCIDEPEEDFEGPNNNWSNDFTEDKGYTRYILYENSGEAFRSQVECRKKVCVPQSKLSDCLNGKASHYKNMRFRYIYIREEGRVW